jgi:Fe-S-cluster-containing dehydrogenase component
MTTSLPRRAFLRVAAAGAAAAAAARIIPLTLTGAPAAEAATADAGRLRRWGMIIDLRYCDGCQSVGKPPQCTEACINGHYAPEPMEWVQVFEGDLPGGGTQFLPSPCQQCQNAPCVDVCPVGATFHTPEGVVLIDQERCIGCRFCMAACPYDRRFFNWGQPSQPAVASDVHYDVEHQTPAKEGTVMKCDFCPDMARAGRPPYCVQSCPNQAIYYGDLEEDVATNGKDVVRFTRYVAENAGYRLKDELGTEPRVYYIPGHGEAVGRDAYTAGRMPTEWNWQDVRKGADTWTR